MRVNGGKTKRHSDSKNITITMGGANREGVMKAKVCLGSKGGSKSLSAHPIRRTQDRHHAHELDLLCPPDVGHIKRWWDGLGLHAQYVCSLRIDGIRATAPNRGALDLTRQLVTFAVPANGAISAAIERTVVVGIPTWPYKVSADADDLHNPLQVTLAVTIRRSARTIFATR
ncbi:hypothetical protein LTR49_026862 [Elasticomyces elasticus]|nr:hypothetical protein LTR49_026862 [Elasticomyces elasticus]